LVWTVWPTAFRRGREGDREKKKKEKDHDHYTTYTLARQSPFLGKKKIDKKRKEEGKIKTSE